MQGYARIRSVCNHTRCLICCIQIVALAMRITNQLGSRTGDRRWNQRMSERALSFLTVQSGSRVLCKLDNVWHSFGHSQAPQGLSCLQDSQESGSFIKLHQASSSFIKLHQASSSFIKLHQASSSFIKLHQASSSFIKLHQASSSFIKLPARAASLPPWASLLLQLFYSKN